MHVWTRRSASGRDGRNHPFFFATKRTPKTHPKRGAFFLSVLELAGPHSNSLGTMCTIRAPVCGGGSRVLFEEVCQNVKRYVPIPLKENQWMFLCFLSNLPTWTLSVFFSFSIVLAVLLLILIQPFFWLFYDSFRSF